MWIGTFRSSQWSSWSFLAALVALVALVVALVALVVVVVVVIVVVCPAKTSTEITNTTLASRTYPIFSLKSWHRNIGLI